MRSVAQAIEALVNAGEALTQWRDYAKSELAFTRLSHWLPHDPASYDRADRLKVRLGLLLIAVLPSRDLGLLLSLAMLAEGQGMENAFRRFMLRAFKTADWIEEAAKPSDAQVRALIAFRQATLDIPRVRDLAERYAAEHPSAATALVQIREIETECAGWRSEIEEARQALAVRLSPNARAHREEGERVEVHVPAAAFRSNDRDYPGFRADIRSLFGILFRVLREEGISPSVRYRLAKHGEVSDRGAPFIAYHTVGGAGRGLHVKETDRPHSFSADPGGYSGWSQFARMSSHVSDPPTFERAREFVLIDRREQVVTNSSKYQQPAQRDDSVPAGCIFVALQVIDDAVQRLSYLHMFDMLDEVSAYAAAHGIPLVVKRHPLCKSGAVGRILKRGVARGCFTLSTASIHTLIGRSRAVCVVNSGVGAEALLHGKPVYAFGACEYRAAARIVRHRGQFAQCFGQEVTEEEAREVEHVLMQLRTRYSTDVTHPLAENWWRARLRGFLAAATPSRPASHAIADVVVAHDDHTPHE